MDKKQDSLRIYHLPEPRSRCVEVMGVSLAYDMHEPLVL